MKKLTKIANSFLNLGFGAIGTIGSYIYIGSTAGVGATLGGATALTFSLGEMSIGLAQIVDGFNSRGNYKQETNNDLQSSGSIPGLIAFGTKTPAADFIDATAQFIPGLLTGGNFKTLLNKPREVLQSVKQGEAGQAIFKSSEWMDAALDTRSVYNSVNNNTSISSKSKPQQVSSRPLTIQQATSPFMFLKGID